MDAGLYVREESEYIFPGLVVVRSKKVGDSLSDNLKFYFEKKILFHQKTMDEFIRDLQEHFSCRVIVDFRELNKRVVSDPYHFPSSPEKARRI